MCLRNNKLTFFSNTPSFADELVKSDHSLDAELLAIYEKVNRAVFPATYSPLPDDEIKHYQALPAPEKQYMLIRNPLLLSRLFIRHARINELSRAFKDKDRIRILDVGCGYAPNLMGILSYFGTNRVDYLGIDLSKENIRTAALAYNQFPQVSFIAQDAIVFLEQQRDLARSYDLILIQHPNFQQDECRTVFKQIFLQLKHITNSDTMIYTTFYSKSELDYFQQNVQPDIDSLSESVLLEPNSYTDKAKFIEQTTNEKQAAEQFILISPPRKKHHFIHSSCISF